MFYLGNRAGLRTGELCGLRLSDLSFLDEGVIRVRYSYDGPLKEDKTGEGKMKWAPAPADAKALLQPHLDVRRAQGAAPESLVFVASTDAEGNDRMFDRVTLGRAWKVATGRRKNARDTTDTGAKADDPIARLSWYQATRHSFVSRNLARGASLDEVSSAVGHSSPLVTRRFYDHFVRRTFSPGLREGLGLGDQGAAAAPVVPLRRPTRGKASTTADAPSTMGGVPADPTATAAKR